jgi:hypothetical protein
MKPYAASLCGPLLVTAAAASERLHARRARPLRLPLRPAQSPCHPNRPSRSEEDRRMSTATVLAYAETLDWLAAREGRLVSVGRESVRFSGPLGPMTMTEVYEECDAHGLPIGQCGDCDRDCSRPVARFAVGDGAYFDLGWASFRAATPYVNRYGCVSIRMWVRDYIIELVVNEAP